MITHCAPEGAGAWPFTGKAHSTLPLQRTLKVQRERRDSSSAGAVQASLARRPGAAFHSKLRDAVEPNALGIVADCGLLRASDARGVQCIVAMSCGWLLAMNALSNQSPRARQVTRQAVCVRVCGLEGGGPLLGLRTDRPRFLGSRALEPADQAQAHITT